MEITDYLHELAISRTKVARIKAEVKDLETQLEESELGRTLAIAKENLKMVEAEQQTLEGGIKHQVEVEFIRNHLENTKPYEGIQIKQFQVVHILDEREAIRWAGENAPGALSIKTAQFNKIAKALDGLEFVKIDKEYRAQIASDLSMYENNQTSTSSTAEE